MFKSRSQAYLATSFLIMSSGLSACASAQELVPEDRINRIQTLVEAADERGWLNCAFQIGSSDQTHYEYTTGYADIQNNELITAQSQLRIASVTKQFTAFATWSLAQEGRIDLNDLVSDHIDGFPYDGVTIAQLVNHTSGLPTRDDVIRQIEDKDGPLHNEDFVALLLDNPPDARGVPGESYRYSNLDYILQGYLVQQITGQSLVEYLQAKIDDRDIGIEFLDFAADPENAPRRYDLDPSTAQWVTPVFLAGNKTDHRLIPTEGPGNLALSVNDLIAWSDALRNGDLYPAEEMTTWFESETQEDNYTYGVHARSNPEIGRSVWHNGRQPGVRSYLGNYLDEGYAFAMICNTDAVHAPMLAMAIDSILQGGEGELPQEILADSLSYMIAYSSPEEIKAYGRQLFEEGAYYSTISVNAVAYLLWEREEFVKGLAVLELNAELAGDSSPVPHIILADGYVETGQPERQIEPLNRAIAILGDDENTASWAQSLREQRDAALQALEEANE